MESPQSFEHIWGLRVIADPRAIWTSARWEVKPWPRRKRRRSWQVVRIVERKPTAFITAPGVMICHPDIYDKVKALYAKHPA